MIRMLSLDLQKTQMGTPPLNSRRKLTMQIFAGIMCAAIASFCLSACSEGASRPGSASVQGGNTTTVQWLDSSKNFGKITEGQKLSVSFRFKNTGSSPLVIASVQPSCGCTVADYPREPIPPGGEGEITGEFDSNGREGLQHKEITVRSNTPGGQQQLLFEVNVVKSSSSQAAGASN